MGSLRRTTRLSLLLHWLPAILAVLVIAFESTSTMSATNTSDWIQDIWTFFASPMTTAHVALLDAILRKIGHVVGYGLVSAAFFYGFKSSLDATGGSLRLWRRAALLAVVCTFLVACADETHQHFLPNRTGSPIDVCIDTGGAILAQFLLLGLRPRAPRLPVASEAPPIRS